ncbi:MAG: hypothetical protein JXQ72_15545 [Anaerolineae bacterium]|nr:hypothetical protein [Anaerolineae bacterium]
MKDGGRVAATLILWIAFTIMFLAIVEVLNSAEEVSMGASAMSVVVLLSILTAVTQSTRAVWGGNSQGKVDESRASRAKTKRQTPSRVERLIEALDDDEIYDLEALLLAREDQDRRVGGRNNS